MKISERITEALASLEAMSRLGSKPIDLCSGVLYEPHSKFPDGEFLAAELPGGKIVAVETHKLLEHLLLRHANAQATREGGSARSAYTDIREHFVRKTGFEF